MNDIFQYLYMCIYIYICTKQTTEYGNELWTVVAAPLPFFYLLKMMVCSDE